MLLRIRLAVALIALAVITLLARGTAHASCAVEQAYIGTDTVPVGCTLAVYVNDSTLTPKIVVVRGGVRVDVTGTFTKEVTQHSIFIEEDSCTGEGHDTQFPMDLYTIELIGVVEGDVLELDNTQARTTAIVVGAASCPAPLSPQIADCPDDTPETCGDDDIIDGNGGGCTTGATPALGIALIAFGLIRRRRPR